MTTSDSKGHSPSAAEGQRAIQTQRALRDAFGSFVTGVTVVTTMGPDGTMAGCTANSFSSVSIDPPLVLWSLARSASSYEIFANSDRFTINVLSEGQRHVSQLFASKGVDKFGQSSWTPGLGGVPVLDGALCFLECRRYASYPGGDHTIFLGQVENFQRLQSRPLVFGGGRYMTALEESPAGVSAELRAGNRARFEAERVAIGMLPEIRNRLGRSVAISMWGDEGPMLLYWELNEDAITEGVRIAHVCSLTDTATGRVFAAYLPPEITSATCAAHVEKSALTETDFDKVLADVREEGVACVTSLETQLISYSAPVYDDSGLMMLALTAVLPLADGADPSVGRNLSEQAAALSKRLGFRADQ
jgi:flavin reductase (DIM6/NTAB) family NADH-FMN oxidoreductase RutF/DNA-binding IclR family transcriptional regulator